MEQTLENITALIDTYEGGSFQTAENLRELLRSLTTNLYHLTKHNIEYHEKHNAVQYKHKGSVSSGLILANEQVPELRMTRKILEASNNVARSMTMELSILKKESN